jgi:rhodanese-related sulfurtransferase
MKNWIFQTLAIVGVSLVATFALYLIVGPPDRSVPCDPTEMKDGQVCIATGMDEWQGKVLWVDARSGKEYAKGHMSEAILIPETDADNQIAVPEHMERIGMAGAEGVKVVVYCGTDACGSSELVAGKIRDTGFHDEVYVLFGGWKAVMAAELAVSR